MIKGVLLDIDGTLVLSNDAHAHSWVDAFKQHGYDVEYDEVRKLIGMGGDKLISTVRPELTDDAGDGKKIQDARSAIFLDTYVSDVQAAPGARELIVALKKYGLHVIAASSAKQDELTALLKSAGIADVLTESTTSDDAENSKPDPDIVQVALDTIDVRPDEAIMIGDTPYDIEAARAASVPCIALRCGGWKDDELTGALAIYDDPADVLSQFAGFLES